MATAHLASMLDELMGRNRNDQNAKELTWRDADVCHFYVVAFCPHDLFTNTRADLGACDKIHDDELRRRFQESGQQEDPQRHRQYVDDFLRYGQRILTELAARIKKSKERLVLTQQRESVLPLNASSEQKDAEEKMGLLSQRIAQLVEEAERAGTDGQVEQAQGLMKLSDQLRLERENLRKSLMPFIREAYASQQKPMDVCEICGAFLIVGDAQSRVDDHLLGKQHIGYARIRQAVDKIEEERRKEREQAEVRRKQQRDHQHEEVHQRRRSRSRSRSRRRSRERRRSRSRSRRRSRSRGRRERSRESRRRRDRSRSSHRSRRSRSRSREEHYRRRRRRSRSKED